MPDVATWITRLDNSSTETSNYNKLEFLAEISIPSSSGAQYGISWCSSTIIVEDANGIRRGSFYSEIWDRSDNDPIRKSEYRGFNIPVNQYRGVSGRWIFAPTISLLSSSTTQRYRIARTSTCWRQVSWLANRSYRIVWPESSGLIDVGSYDPRHLGFLFHHTEFHASFSDTHRRRPSQRCCHFPHDSTNTRTSFIKPDFGKPRTGE